MPLIEAIYQGGVFRPLREVHLPENQRVLLNVQLPAGAEVSTGRAEARVFRQKIIVERDSFPASTSDIAADRVRDE
jgi:predicted DNA-binding antitoxin AbrB/MazE fold protein